MVRGTGPLEVDLNDIYERIERIEEWIKKHDKAHRITAEALKLNWNEPLRQNETTDERVKRLLKQAEEEYK